MPTSDAIVIGSVDFEKRLHRFAGVEIGINMAEAPLITHWEHQYGNGLAKHWATGPSTTLAECG
ncbi:hypothetical protein, partial [Bradyrhizobium tunisiense]|uniref:hypothetical protein n=1 Tax=Bradyrhizobium tunisiense TaxID=3278709 RepID=UPI0035DCFAF9